MTTFVGAFLREVGHLFVEMAPYLLIGLTVAGVLSAFLRDDFVARHIGKSGPAAVVKAAILGVPLPLCSCGVIPTAAYFKRAGASRPAVMSFLVSTPQTGVDSIAATYGMLGPLFAVFRPVVAFLTGIAGGFVSLLDERRTGEVPQTDRRIAVEDKERPQTVGAKVAAVVRYAYVEAVDGIATSFLVGLGIAGVIGLLIPDDFFVGSVLGSGLPAMLLMVLVGIPMYVCSTSSIPIAVALVAKGLSPGAAYVFLVAGPATNAASLAVLSRVLGRRQTALYVATIIVGSLLAAPVMDSIAVSVGWSLPTTISDSGHADGPTVTSALTAGALAVMLLASLVRRWRRSGGAFRAAGKRNGRSESGSAPSAPLLGVEGMTCNCCAAAVETAVRSREGVTRVEVNLQSKTVLAEGITSVRRVADAVLRAGYEPVEGDTQR